MMVDSTPPAERETVCPDCVRGWSHHESCMGWHTSDEEKATIGHCMEDCGADECYKICRTCKPPAAPRQTPQA